MTVHVLETAFDTLLFQMLGLRTAGVHQHREWPCAKEPQSDNVIPLRIAKASIDSRMMLAMDLSVVSCEWRDYDIQPQSALSWLRWSIFATSPNSLRSLQRCSSISTTFFVT
jgi:hypothetical protein